MDNKQFQKKVNELTSEITELHSSIIKGVSRLTNPDKLIRELKVDLKLKKSSFRYEGMISSSASIIDVLVTPKNVGRATKLLDAFVKLLKARGHQITFKNNLTYLIVAEEEIPMALKERRNRTMVQGKYYPQAQYSPSNVLYFKIGTSYWVREFSDTTIPLEDKLAKIVAWLEVESQRKKIERAEIRAYHEKREREREAELKAQKMKEDELYKFKELLNGANRWHQTKILREYVKTKAEHTSQCQDIKDWVEWANKKADWYDPLIEINDDLLNDYNRDELFINAIEY